jgi:hypothetical protein
MNCQAVQNHLLRSERPDHPSFSVSAHLKSCADCRAWSRRLIHVERNVALLPVPAAPMGKAEFVRRFVGGEPVRPAVEPADAAAVNGRTSFQIWKFEHLAAALRSTLHAPRNTLDSVPAPARRRIAAVMAAALLFLALGLWTSGPHFPANWQPQPDVLLAKVMQHDVRLASPLSAKQRVETLADLADALQTDAREMADAASPGDLEALAGMYEHVVQEGIVKQTLAAPAADRATVAEGIGERLHTTSEDAERVARSQPEEKAAPLHAIARAARAGEQQLPQGDLKTRTMRDPFAPPTVLFASFAFADPIQGLSPKERTEQFRRNRALIEGMVRNSLKLLEKNEPLHRAEVCREMVEELAHEIRQANAAANGARSVELARHLNVLLKQGVAANLKAADKVIPAGTSEKDRLEAEQDKAIESLRKLEAEWQPTGAILSDDDNRALREVQEGRGAVEKAMTRKGKN